jgi:hypothetical protein
VGLGSLLAQIVSDPPTPLRQPRPELNPDLEAICLRMLAKKPANRPRSMAEVAGVMEAILRGSPRTATSLSQDPSRLIFAQLFENPDNPPAEDTEVVSLRPSLRRSRISSRVQPRPQAWWPWVIGIGTATLAIVVGLVLVFTSGSRKGTVLIELSNPKATVDIRVDGRRIELRALDQPLALAPGEHEVTVQGPGFETVAEPFTIKAGKETRLPVALKSLQQTPAPSPKRGWLRNPSFEDGFIGWEKRADPDSLIIDFDTEIKKHGRQSLHVTAIQWIDAGFAQEVVLRPNQWYQLSGWVRTRDLDPGANSWVYGTFQVQKPNGSGIIETGKNNKGNTPWTEVVVPPFQAPGDGLVRICVFFVCFCQGRGQAWFDDLKLVELSAPPAAPPPAPSAKPPQSKKKP